MISTEFLVTQIIPKKCHFKITKYVCILILNACLSNFNIILIFEKVKKMPKRTSFKMEWRETFFYSCNTMIAGKVVLWSFIISHEKNKTKVSRLHIVAVNVKSITCVSFNCVGEIPKNEHLNSEKIHPLSNFAWKIRLVLAYSQ